MNKKCLHRFVSISPEILNQPLLGVYGYEETCIDCGAIRIIPLVQKNEIFKTKIFSYNFTLVRFTKYIPKPLFFIKKIGEGEDFRFANFGYKFFSKNYNFLSINIFGIALKMYFYKSFDNK